MTKVFLSLIYYSFYLIFPLIILLIWLTKKRTNKKITFEIIILLTISLFLIWSRFIEPNLLITKKYKFNLENPDNKLKVIIFSDIHIGVYNEKKILDRVVKKIDKINPDLVLIPGDFVYFADEEKLNDYFSILSRIEAPKLAVLGNHDYGREENNISQRITSSLEKAGVLMIDNKTKVLEINNKRIEFIGLADIWVGNPDYSVLNSDNSESGVSLRILLSHNPDSVYEVSSLNNAKKIDLMISGHTHAGQIRLPIIYKKIIPSEHGFDKGFYNINNINLFITPGIGNVALPLRFLNLPEISLMEVNF